MHKSILIAATATLSLTATPALAQAASPADDATKFVTTIIDKFNAGDAKAWVSAQADDTMIVDEFAPHAWSGAGSAQHWLDDYMKDAQSNGVSGGRVDYGKPLQASSDGSTAYVVLPTTYRFVQKGTKMAEPSSMTFVLKHGVNGWKITSWTYSATGAAAPQK
jgi:ketosteroid isomerase-like protein